MGETWRGLGKLPGSGESQKSTSIPLLPPAVVVSLRPLEMLQPSYSLQMKPTPKMAEMERTWGLADVTEPPKPSTPQPILLPSIQNCPTASSSETTHTTAHRTSGSWSYTVRPSCLRIEFCYC